MTTTVEEGLAGKGILRAIVYLMLGSTTLVIAINANDSSVAKTPLLVLLASLLVITFIAQAIWKGRLEIHRSPADLPVVLMLILALVSLAYAPDRWSSLRALAVWISFFVCFFAGTQLFVTQSDLARLIRVTAAIASLVCVVGLLQYFFADRLFFEFFIGADRRVASTLANPIYLSGYIVLLFPTLLAFTLAKKRTFRERWSLAFLLGALAFLLVATSTRSSIIAFGVSMVVFAALSRRVKKTSLWAIAAVLVALGVALYLSPTLMRRIDYAFAQDPSSSFARRLYFWQAGFAALKAAPLFGHGIGSFEAVVLGYRSPEYWVVKSEDIVPHAHNEIIETAVDLGVVGVTAYLAILAAIVFAAVKSRTRENPQDRLITVGLLCSLIAICVDNVASMSLRVVPVGAMAWLIMGALASKPFRKEPDIAIGLRVPRSSAFVLLLLWFTFAAWYTRQEFGIYKSEGHLINGILDEQRGDLPACISEFQHAIAQNPHNLLARSNLTLAFLRMGRAPEALESSERLQALSPRYPKSNLMQAAAYISLKRYSDALQSIHRELELRTHPDAYTYQAIAFRGLSDTTGELTALKRLLGACIKGQIPIEFEPVAARVQRLATHDGDNRELAGIFERLSSLFPSNRSIASALAEFYRRIGESDKAEQLFQRLAPDPSKR